MPTYGYRCTVCENTFEQIQKITDPPLTECISCGGLVKKMVYPVGIQFKGSGFYVNDYSAKKTSTSDSGSSSTTSSAAKSESTTETKTETKTESTPATPAAATTTTPSA